MNSYREQSHKKDDGSPRYSTLHKLDPLDEFMCYFALWAQMKNNLRRLGADEFSFKQWHKQGDEQLVYYVPASLNEIWAINPYSHDARRAKFTEYALVSKPLEEGWSIFIAIAPEINTVFWYLGGRHFWGKDSFYWRYENGEYGTMFGVYLLRDIATCKEKQE